MSFAHGRHFTSMPGPSTMPDSVLRAMHRDTPNIYEGEIVEITERVLSGLRTVVRTEGHAILYVSNGHGAWEAALTNLLSKGDRLLALYTGRFTRGWAQMARDLGADIVELDFGPRGAVDADQVVAALRADPSIRAVLMVQTDTATSVLNDVRAVRAALDTTKHDALLMVDCIASLACDEFHMDSWGVDVVVAASQKGLMTPPGIGINFVNAKALAVRERATLVTPYWDWKPRSSGDAYYQKFFGTAPTHHLFGLDEALRMIEAEGLANVWVRHRALAGAVHAAVEAWGDGGPWELNIQDAARRSMAVTTIRTGSIDATELRAYCEKQLGLTLGAGLSLSSPSAGGREQNVFRIGHMGHLNPPMIIGILGAIETAMNALGLPHGKGALDAAAAAIARRL